MDDRHINTGLLYADLKAGLAAAARAAADDLAELNPGFHTAHRVLENGCIEITLASEPFQTVIDELPLARAKARGKAQKPDSTDAI